MDQIICASLSHTPYRYEVGMLKVPVIGHTTVSSTGTRCDIMYQVSDTNLSLETKFSGANEERK